VRRGFALAAGALAWLALVACGGGESGGALDWERCGGMLECATLAVPLDYDHPEGRALELALVRLPARDPDRRIGSLVVNPGGPGQSGMEVVRAGVKVLFGGELLERFDVIGFDPRGVGASSPISCHEDLETLLAADPSPDDATEAQAVSETTDAFVEACTERHAGILPFLGTVNAARDLDRIREALGDEKLTFVGFSYGTRLGSVYAHLFPGRVRALVLDGGVHPSAGLDQVSEEGADALESALDRFFAECRATEECPIGPRPEDAWDRAGASAEGGKEPGLFYLGARLLLYDHALGWPLLRIALEAAGKGNDSVLRATARLAFPPAGNAVEAGLAVYCADEPARLSRAEYLELVHGLEEDFPRLGFTASGGCFEGWPAPAEPLPRVRAAGAPPILVIGTTHDPATPYAWSQALADALEPGVLVTLEGDGHTAIPSGNSCVAGLVEAYLIDLAVPAEGTVCRAG